MGKLYVYSGTDRVKLKTSFTGHQEFGMLRFGSSSRSKQGLFAVTFPGLSEYCIYSPMCDALIIQYLV